MVGGRSALRQDCRGGHPALGQTPWGAFGGGDNLHYYTGIKK